MLGIESGPLSDCAERQVIPVVRVDLAERAESLQLSFADRDCHVGDTQARMRLRG